jgi:hypothetical protein
MERKLEKIQKRFFLVADNFLQYKEGTMVSLEQAGEVTNDDKDAAQELQ